MEFRILGPFEVRSEGRQLSLGGTKQRAVLAVLLLYRNEVVSIDRLVDELWGDRPPAPLLWSGPGSSPRRCERALTNSSSASFNWSRVVS